MLIRSSAACSSCAAQQEQSAAAADLMRHRRIVLHKRIVFHNSRLLDIAATGLMTGFGQAMSRLEFSRDRAADLAPRNKIVRARLTGAKTTQFTMAQP
jgi:hypothetical protein